MLFRSEALNQSLFRPTSPGGGRPAETGGGINSRAVTPLVGDMGSFIFVDSFPNLGSWADTKAVMNSGEGQKIEAALEEVSDCTSNRLYTSTQ